MQSGLRLQTRAFQRVADGLIKPQILAGEIPDFVLVTGAHKLFTSLLSIVDRYKLKTTHPEDNVREIDDEGNYNTCSVKPQNKKALTWVTLRRAACQKQNTSRLRRLLCKKYRQQVGLLDRDA